MESVDMALELWARLLELGQSRISTGRAGKRPGKSSGTLQENLERMVRPEVAFLLTCPPLSWQIFVPKRSDIPSQCTLKPLNHEIMVNQDPLPLVLSSSRDIKVTERSRYKTPIGASVNKLDA
ncbi:hypothetical protein Tco_0285249 [Tanacetum coccineum]